MRKLGLSLALAAPLAIAAIPNANAAPASLTSHFTGDGVVATHASAAPARGRQAPLSCTTSRPSSTALRNAEGQIFLLINRQRIRYGVRPLRLDSRITAAARGHSEAMARTGVFAHVVPGERPVPDRLRVRGVTFRAWGENIYYDNSCRTPPRPSWNVAAFAQKAVTGWMNSPGHRRNILDRTFDYTGVGVAAAVWRGTGWLYATQDFVRR